MVDVLYILMLFTFSGDPNSRNDRTVERRKMTPNTKIQNRGKAEQRKIHRNPKRRDDEKSPNIPKEGTVNNVKQSCPKRLMLRARDLRKISSLLTPPQPPPPKKRVN